MIIDKKIALVTGASRGIGKSIAQKLGQDNYYVIGTATTDQNAKKISNYFAEHKIAGEGRSLNLLDKEAVGLFLKTVITDFSCVDVLVNNAAITRDNLLLRMKDSEWSEVMSVNLDSVFAITRSLLKPMLKKRWGINSLSERWIC